VLRFFDTNATTPLWPEARAAWNETVDELWMNPSSPYRAAARVRVRLEEAREAVAEVFGLPAERLVFNSGATEGNDAVFRYWARSLPGEARIGVGPTEHPSVTAAARHYFGERVRWLPLDANGAVDLDAIDFRGLSAVSAMAANNETGVLNPWPGIAAACREAGVPYHCDASQWIGKLPPEGLRDCDFVTACAHKFGGPRGVGFWLLSERGGGFAGQAGGEQEGGRRAGTQDVAGIRAMAAALMKAESLRPKLSPAYRDAFLAALLERLPGTEAVGLGAERLWNTACAILPEFASPRWIRALEKRGFLISAGSACSTGKEGPSPVLAAMGLPPDQMRRAVRISSGWLSSAEDWRSLLEAILSAYGALRAESGNGGGQVISI